MKKTYFLFLLSFIALNYLNAQGDCSTALTPASGTNSITTTASEYYWYKFTTSVDPVKLVLSAPAGTYIEVTRNTCDIPFFVADNYDGQITIIEPNTENDYYFKIKTNGGNFDWQFSELPLSAGDNCDNAVAASIGTNTQPTSSNEYYWFKHTIAESDKKLVISSTSGKAVRVYKNGCNFSNSVSSAISNVNTTGLESGDEVFISWKIAGGDAFDWNLSMEDYDAGEICSSAIVAEEITNGNNTVPVTNASEYWYTFTMPDVDNSRIYFDWPFLVDATIYEGTCDNLTDAKNVLGGSGFATTGYLANQQFFIRLNLNNQSNFDWSIRIEVPVPGDDCTTPAVASLETNVLPETSRVNFWYEYVLPASVDGKKLKVESESDATISLYAPDCLNNSKLEEGSQEVSTLEITANASIFIRFSALSGGNFNWTLSLIDTEAGDLCDLPKDATKGINVTSLSSRWFTFEAPKADTYTISSIGNTTVNTELKIYDVCGGVVRAMNDDSGGNQSQLQLALTSGEEILIYWTKKWSSVGFDWSLTAASDQTITFAPLPTKVFGDNPFDLTAAASSGLPVTFSSSDETVATVSQNTVTIVGAGTTTITASQNGDDTNTAAVPIGRELVVDKANQTIMITQIGNKISTDAPFSIEASTTSGLPLSYSILEGPASIEDNTVTLSGNAGTVKIEVNQLGNENYNIASSSISFDVSLDPCIGFAIDEAIVKNITCNGESDGAITVIMSTGASPYSYSIDGLSFKTSNEFEGLSSGEYTISVKDKNDCSATIKASINEPSEISIETTIVESTNGENNGSIALTVTGGVSPYEYSWSNDATTSKVTGLTKGEYTVTLTDAGGCTINSTFTVGGIITSSGDDIQEALVIFPNPVMTELSLKHMNLKSGTALAIFDAKGVVVMKGEIADKVSSLQIDHLPAGIYYLKIQNRLDQLKFIKK